MLRGVPAQASQVLQLPGVQTDAAPNEGSNGTARAPLTATLDTPRGRVVIDAGI
jgi:hypothetical protein